MISRIRRFVPALVLVALIASLALWGESLPLLRHVGALALALLLGLGLRVLWRVPEAYVAGVSWAARALLRWGIVLLGVRLDLMLVWEAGVAILAISASVVLCGLIGISWLGRRLGLGPVLAMLIAVDSSICGGSAVAAAAPVVGARERDVALVVPMCSLLGTVLMLGYTVVQQWWPLSELRYGVLVGASLHEVAQVVAAVTPFAGAVEPGMVAKLSRVALLVPAVAVLGWVWGRASGGKSREPNAAPARKVSSAPAAPRPWFVLGFFAVSLANTVFLHAWPEARGLVEQVDGLLLHSAVFLMAMAMAAMGLGTDFAHLRENGLRAFACALLGWLGIAGLVAAELAVFT
ncbi:hypothetical protein AXK11_08960 [Cephaloticoccus primus]|uniref:Sulfate exporter family transporter n=1 Tax=Cephaloticoccus primus TaxID=1548207 RepID=A0A139SHT9_9BACT|nr:putative sulfate exporter family transporter [Cephaloticoccus primus]KXU34054.1 hypothetical protein AXK11_08960 [Cephaloticoccus primus]